MTFSLRCCRVREFAHVPDTFFDAGDDVITFGHYHSRAKATGKEMTAGFAHIWSLNDGKAARLRHYADTVQLAGAS